MKEKMDEKLINQSTCTCMYPDSTLLLGKKTNGVSSTVGELVTVYNIVYIHVDRCTCTVSVIQLIQFKPH